ncbi:hypothetical protein T484DRAFT_2645215 [Baffinella frigidus]|nr:hypothetical protein T484DRAFT_2645215 [Cryptophyta sp. CCMP2293]
MMCGQNVGRGRGCAAGAGLWAMKTFVPSVGAAGMLTSLVDAAKKNGHVQEEIIVRDFSRAGDEGDGPCIGAAELRRASALHERDQGPPRLREPVARRVQRRGAYRLPGRRPLFLARRPVRGENSGRRLQMDHEQGSGAQQRVSPQVAGGHLSLKWRAATYPLSGGRALRWS